MKKPIKITENQLSKVIKRMLKESNIEKYDPSNTPVSPTDILDAKQFKAPILDRLNQLDHARSYKDVANIMTDIISECEQIYWDISHNIDSEEDEF